MTASQHPSHPGRRPRPASVAALVSRQLFPHGRHRLALRRQIRHQQSGGLDDRLNAEGAAAAASCIIAFFTWKSNNVQSVHADHGPSTREMPLTAVVYGPDSRPGRDALLWHRADLHSYSTPGSIAPASSATHYHNTTNLPPRPFPNSNARTAPRSTLLPRARKHHNTTGFLTTKPSPDAAASSFVRAPSLHTALPPPSPLSSRQNATAIYPPQPVS